MSTTTAEESAADSETPKDKGGRPPAHESELMALFEGMGLFGDIKSRRGKVDFCYRTEAIRALCPTDSNGVEVSLFPWLVDAAAIDAGNDTSWQPSILTELGRFRNHNLIREAARQLSEVRNQAEPESPLTSKEAVAMLRQARLANKKAQS
jgi:hypothetical protein